MKFNKDVTPDEFAKLNKLLSSFEKKEVKKIGNNVQDLMYAAKLAEHIKNLEDFSGHLKWFKEGTNLSFDAYPRHKLFLDCTAKYRQTLFMAANQLGKTQVASIALSSWATGIYHSRWKGRVFEKPIRAWAVGDTSQTARDILQAKLLGPIGSWGTGMIPKNCIVDVVTKPNTGGLADSIYVKHVPTNGVSRISLKSYEQGQKAFQGEVVDVIWLDEEPTGKDAEFIYSECLQRLFNSDGAMIITFTPLHGLTPLVMRFKEEADIVADESDLAKEFKPKALVQAGWEHAGHITPQMIEEFKSQCPPHLLDARMNGNPTMGSGNVYPISRSVIEVDPFQIPRHWKRVCGLDVGFKVTAAEFLAIDPDNDVVYLVDEYRGENQNPASNAAGIRHRTGSWMPVMIDPASNGRSQVDGTKLIVEYRKEGLDVRPADNAVEAGIFNIWNRLQTGRLKIFKTCQHTLKEYEMYRRDVNGKIVKSNDHHMDALRYAVMSLQHAKFEHVSDPYGNYEYKNPYQF